MARTLLFCLNDEDQPLRVPAVTEETQCFRCETGQDLPKKSACSSRGRCNAQSSLTLWSTTISVMKMTAMLHLRIVTHSRLI